MSKVILIANQCVTPIIDSDADYIGIDGGAYTCIKNNISMICAIGDFDSIEEELFMKLKEETKLIVLPKEKDMVDSEYAIRYAHKLGYKEIEIQGVIGGRQDHFVTIYNFLKTQDISFVIKDYQNCIYALNKGNYIIKKKSKYISIFACEKVTITFTGVKYPLKGVSICEKDIYLVSNEIVENTAYLKTSGKVIIMECDDKK